MFNTEQFVLSAGKYAEIKQISKYKQLKKTNHMIYITRIKHISNNTIVSEKCTNTRTSKGIEQFKQNYRKKNKVPDEIIIDLEYKEK